MSAERAKLVEKICNESLRAGIPQFRVGDTLRVHAKIVEGQKERVQIFEGVVIKRHSGQRSNASFTVRKVSYNIGVERTFLLHSPRIEKIEVLTQGLTRRARLYHLRPLRGKAAKIKSKAYEAPAEDSSVEEAAPKTTNGNGSAKNPSDSTQEMAGAAS